MALVPSASSARGAANNAAAGRPLTPSSSAASASTASRNGAAGWCATPAPIWPAPLRGVEHPGRDLRRDVELGDQAGVDPDRAAGEVERRHREPARAAHGDLAHQLGARERVGGAPPKNDATAGEAATAMPPRPTHSITAESPMSSAASSSVNPSRSSAS